MPLVSVLMPVFNAESYLKEAIESILSQTFKDFEFVIIDDGSTDDSRFIIDEYALKDTRIKTHRNSKNEGLIASLNFGIGLCSGEYIARMDSDDISLPNRLEAQVNFMQANPKVGVCGSYWQVIPDGTVVTPPCSNEEIKLYLVYDCAFAHPSITMRRDVFADGKNSYDKNYVHSEDYKLWVDLATQTEFANIPLVLLKYRKHFSQVSRLHQLKQIDMRRSIRVLLLKKNGIQSDDNDLILDEVLFNNTYEPTLEFIARIEKRMRVLRRSLIESSYISSQFIDDFFFRKWKNFTYGSTRLGPRFWHIFKRSELSQYATLSVPFKIKFWLKCLLYL